ncbi:MAG: hypothetical protein ACREJ5_00685 [Geminicoccaceae bacterium]
MSFRTQGLALGCGMDRHIETACACITRLSCEGDLAGARGLRFAREGQPVE